MRDTALFPLTACSQRLPSSRKHTVTGREKDMQRQTDKGGETGEILEVRVKVISPLSKDVLQSSVWHRLRLS